jgi:CRISPR-associated protein Csb2
MPALLISVRFHDGRYHGAGEWPPSPARLFQALIAGAARGRALADTDREALARLEALDPPVIAAPTVRNGHGFRNYVPNNDLDAVGGDLRRIGEIRAPKMIRPRLFDPDQPLLYAWFFQSVENEEAHARTIAAMTEKLYQLGRGVDMAWAWAEIVDGNEAETRLAGHGGPIYRPGRAGGGKPLSCPQRGSLRSLQERFRANQRRFSASGEKGEQLFSQAPKPRFRTISYDCPPTLRLFDLQWTDIGDHPPTFEQATQTVALVTAVRDRAAARLKQALPDKAACIERMMIGRDAAEADKAMRVRIIPLPSIGHPQADRQIRRILIEIPPNCPLPPAAVFERGFSGLHLGMDPETGEIVDDTQPLLTPAADDSMLRHYGIGSSRSLRVWRTVTPAALPQTAGRRRIEPARIGGRAERKAAAERLQKEGCAARAVLQALRHAGVSAPVTAVRLQREPFAARSERAEAFAPGSRFPKERLWHVEVAFSEPMPGPLVIGDGRYLGLGLMEPVPERARDLIVFQLMADPAVSTEDRVPLLQAVRRALMARARQDDGSVPRMFSGHESDGRAARSGRHEHVFLAAADFDRDGCIDRLVVAAPWRCDRAVPPSPSQAHLFERVASSLAVVRAGRLGVVRLDPDPVSSETEPLTGSGLVWESHTRYRPTRPVRNGEAASDILLRDISGECRRRGLPAPVIELLDMAETGAQSMTARLRLRFAVPVTGPVLLGRDSHQGGGLFLVADGRSQIAV